MKLSKVRVQNYRSIVDSGVVDIEERVTVLIGKNEQGKTTFLKALASADPRQKYTPGDLPSHLQPELEQQKPSEIPIVTVWISLEDADAKVVRALSDPGTIAQIKVVKYYDNHRSYSIIRQNGTEEPLAFPPPDISPYLKKIKAEAEALRSKLTNHSTRLPAFTPHLPQAVGIIDQFVNANFSTDQIDNLIQTLAAGLTSVPGQDAAVQTDVAEATKSLQAVQAEIIGAIKKEPRPAFEAELPHFVYHSTTIDRIPNDVPIAEFVANPNTVSRGMANLCAVAGLSMQKIQELASSSDPHNVERFEDHYKASVSGAINEFWTQEEYTVNFRFGHDKMSVSISDKTYARRIPPLERSEGFQWYLSFYATLQNEVAAAKSTVFLLDNPGLELHADGQRDIKRFLEEKLMPNAQIVYVTHSPAMIDPFRLDQVRKVELQSGMLGTAVGALEIKEGEDFDLFDPVRTAIGASLATSLILNEYNVLVEGAADKPILEGAFQAYQKDAKHKVLINGSVAESKDGFLVQFYERAKVPFVVYLDADSSGRQLAERVKKWMSGDRIVKLSDVFNDRQNDFEIEDIISETSYHNAVKAEYENVGEQPPAGNGKKTKKYEQAFRDQHGIGFNKRRVAERLKTMIIEDTVDDETRQNLTKLTDAIMASLDRQIGRSQAPVDGRATANASDTVIAAPQKPRMEKSAQPVKSGPPKASDEGAATPAPGGTGGAEVAGAPGED